MLVYEIRITYVGTSTCIMARVRKKDFIQNLPQLVHCTYCTTYLIPIITVCTYIVSIRWKSNIGCDASKFDWNDLFVILVALQLLFSQIRRVTFFQVLLIFSLAPCAFTRPRVFANYRERWAIRSWLFLQTATEGHHEEIACTGPWIFNKIEFSILSNRKNLEFNFEALPQIELS